MTKRKDSLAKECDVMAARCAWLIKPASGTAPTTTSDDATNILFTRCGDKDERVDALAQFGLQRWIDFRREDPKGRNGQRSRIVEQQEEARMKWKASHERLLASHRALEAATSLWRHGADIERELAKKHGMADAGVADAAALFDKLKHLLAELDDVAAAMRVLRTNGRFGVGAYAALEGMTQREWQTALKVQAKKLAEAGVTAAEVAFVCNWSDEVSKPAARKAVRRTSQIPEG